MTSELPVSLLSSSDSGCSCTGSALACPQSSLWNYPILIVLGCKVMEQLQWFCLHPSLSHGSRYRHKWTDIWIGKLIQTTIYTSWRSFTNWNNSLQSRPTSQDFLNQVKFPKNHEDSDFIVQSPTFSVRGQERPPPRFRCYSEKILHCGNEPVDASNGDMKSWHGSSYYARLVSLGRVILD